MSTLSEVERQRLLIVHANLLYQAVVFLHDNNLLDEFIQNHKITSSIIVKNETGDQKFIAEKIQEYSLKILEGHKNSIETFLAQTSTNSLMANFLIDLLEGKIQM